MSKIRNRNMDGGAEVSREEVAREAFDEFPPACQLPPSNDEDPLMTQSEVAAYVGKHPATIGRWIADGLLEAVRVGPLHKIRRSVLAKFLGGSALQPKA